MLLRFIIAGLCLSATALISGCSSPVNMATEARESALAVEDAYEGYMLLVEVAENMPFYFFSRGNVISDAQREGWTIMEQAADELLMRAVEHGNEKLLLAAIDNRVGISEAIQPSLETKVRVVELLLEQLEENESVFSSETLILLSEQLRRGEYAIQNYHRAVRIAELAWQRGDVSAAKQLMLIYNDTNDIENAYFWGLRCIGECGGLTQSSVLKVIIPKLTTEDIHRIQAAATDSSNLRVAF